MTRNILGDRLGITLAVNDLPLSVRVPIWLAATLGLWACLESGRKARTLWTVGVAIYLVHLWAVFEYLHDWSHAKALAHVAQTTLRVTGTNASYGLYINYAFSLAWVLYVLASYWTELPRWVHRAWAAWFLFMAFNGCIVFVLNPFRWLGVALFGIFGIVAFVRSQKAVALEK